MRGGPRTPVLVGGLAALTVASLTGDLLSPTLLGRHPLVLVSLTPRAPFVLAASHGAPLVAVLAVAVPRLLLADPLHFVLGRRYAGRIGRRLPASVRRIGVPAIVASPTGKVLAAAGATGMPPSRVAAADTVGTVARVAALWAVANALPGVGVIASVSSAAPLAALLTVLGLVAARRITRRATTASSPVHPLFSRRSPRANIISGRGRRATRRAAVASTTR